MRGFIVTHQSVLVSFWLGSTVDAICKVLVVGSSNWTYKYHTRSFAIVVTLLFDDFCWLTRFTVEQFLESDSSNQVYGLTSSNACI